MKPSQRYNVIKAQVLASHPGIKEPYATEKALLALLDDLHPEPKQTPLNPQADLKGLPPLPPPKGSK